MVLLRDRKLGPKCWTQGGGDRRNGIPLPPGLPPPELDPEAAPPPKQVGFQQGARLQNCVCEHPTGGLTRGAGGSRMTCGRGPLAGIIVLLPTDR
ncbi:unnamed protein product [Boreogadus saida]